MGNKFHRIVDRICLELCVENDSEVYQGKHSRGTYAKHLLCLLYSSDSQPNIYIQCPMKLYQIPHDQAPPKICEIRVSRGGARVCVACYYHVILIAEGRPTGDSWLWIFLRNHS